MKVSPDVQDEQLDEAELAEWLDNPEMRTRVANDVEWRDWLLQGKTGLRPTLANAIVFLRYHEAWRDVLAYDEFADTVMKLKPPPWSKKDAPATITMGEWQDADTDRAVAWLARAEGIEFKPGVVESAVKIVADAKTYHPVRDYLKSLKWDHDTRLFRLLPKYLGADDNAYTQGIGKRWMISAVARIMKPGCQADCALILEGVQGIGKTTAMRALMKDERWYADTGISPGEKDGYQNLRSVWIYGLDELDSLKRSEVTRIKNFISTQSDRYRPSFGRRARTFPRQCVFVGTTNETEYLVDSTGNRRFWPVKVKRKIDVDAIRRDRDQLWAEALVCYESGHHWHVDTDEFRKLCDEAQKERQQEDPWTKRILHWLQRPIVGASSSDVGQGVTTSEVLEYALDKRPGDITMSDGLRVAKVLRALGYERGPQRREGEAMVRRYSKV